MLPCCRVAVLPCCPLPQPCALRLWKCTDPCPRPCAGIRRTDGRSATSTLATKAKRWCKVNYTSYIAPLLQNGAQHLDLRCIWHPAPAGSGCKARLESRITKSLVSFFFTNDCSGTSIQLDFCTGFTPRSPSKRAGRHCRQTTHAHLRKGARRQSHGGWTSGARTAGARTYSVAWPVVLPDVMREAVR